MCLKEITPTIRPVRHGYQVMRRTGSDMYPVKDLYYRGHTRRYPLNTWVRATGPTIRLSGSGPPYPPGFHVWHNFEDALSTYNNYQNSDAYAIMLVEIRNPIVAGLERIPGVPDRDGFCTVTKERRIIEEVKL